MLSLLDALNRLLNRWFAGPIDVLLAHLGIHPAQPHNPITNALTLELVGCALLLLFFIAVRLTLSIEKPGVIQMTAETVYTFVDVCAGLQSFRVAAGHHDADFEPRGAARHCGADVCSL
jgi:hypothetical protein